MRHLIVNLESPLMAFGGEAIDNLGVIRPFPAASMLTGMFANALGWRRIQREAHERLQRRLVFAARIDREPAGGYAMTDYQTVQMGNTVDLFPSGSSWVIGWTTRGAPETRTGALGTRNSPPFTHQRWRDYYADMRVTVALRLDSGSGAGMTAGRGSRRIHPHPSLPPSRGKEQMDEPTLDGLAAALDEPARPLFIGRKPCLPSVRLYGGFVDAPDALAALLAVPLPDDADGRRTVRMQWPAREGGDRPPEGVTVSREMMLTDERNWVSGLHGGGRRVVEGTAPPGAFGGGDSSAGLGMTRREESAT